MRSRLRLFLADSRASVLIETALIAPIMLIMSLGAFDLSRLVARQTELQEVAAEVSAIAMASTPDGESLAALKTIAVTSANVTSQNVTLAQYYRCDSDTTLQTSSSACGEEDEVSSLIQLRIQSTYTPIWVSFGVGGPVNLDVSRMVQIG